MYIFHRFPLNFKRHLKKAHFSLMRGKLTGQLLTIWNTWRHNSIGTVWDSFADCIEWLGRIQNTSRFLSRTLESIKMYLNCQAIAVEAKQKKQTNIYIACLSSNTNWSWIFLSFFKVKLLPKLFYTEGRFLFVCLKCVILLSRAEVNVKLATMSHEMQQDLILSQ